MEISTLLLAAIAITVSVAVALWVVNIAFHHTGFEVLDVSCRAEMDLVTVSIRNKGTRTVTVVGVVVDGEHSDLNISLKPGEFKELELPVSRSGAVQVEVRTLGKVYPCLVEVRG